MLALLAFLWPISGGQSHFQGGQTAPLAAPKKIPGHQSHLSFGLLGMGEHVRLEVGRLSKSLVTAIKRAHIRAVSGVDANVCTEVEVQGEPLPTTLKSALQSRMKTTTDMNQDSE